LIFYFFEKREKNNTTGTDTPLDILKKRYAKGEITKEEFDEIKKDL
jgi:putative membrane protein